MSSATIETRAASSFLRRQDTIELLSSVVLATSQEEIVADLSDPRPNYNWQAEAVCAQTDPELFFPEKGTYKGKNKTTVETICASCPVIGRCVLNEVRQGEETHGVQGATTVKQRTAWKKIGKKEQIIQIANHVTGLRKQYPIATTNIEKPASGARKKQRRYEVFRYNTADRFIENGPLDEAERRLLDAFRIVAVARVGVKEAAEHYDVPEARVVELLQSMKARFNHLPPNVRIRLLDNDPGRTLLRIPKDSPAYVSAIFDMLDLRNKRSNFKLTPGDRLAILRAIDKDGECIEDQAVKYGVSHETIDETLSRARQKLATFDECVQDAILNRCPKSDFTSLQIDSPEYLNEVYRYLDINHPSKPRKVPQGEWVVVLRSVLLDGKSCVQESERLGIQPSAVANMVQKLKAKLDLLPSEVQAHILAEKPRQPIAELASDSKEFLDSACHLLGININNPRVNPSPENQLVALCRSLRGESKRALAEEYGVSYHHMVKVINRLHGRYFSLSEDEQKAIAAFLDSALS